MTKSQLIESLATTEGITLKASEEAVNAVFNSIAGALVHGNRVEIRGLGSFTVKKYDGYDGHNPRSGEKIEVRPKKLPFFKVGKELKTRLNVGDNDAASSD